MAKAKRDLKDVRAAKNKVDAALTELAAACNALDWDWYQQPFFERCDYWLRQDPRRMQDPVRVAKETILKLRCASNPMRLSAMASALYLLYYIESASGGYEAVRDYLEELK